MKNNNQININMSFKMTRLCSFFQRMTKCVIISMIILACFITYLSADYVENMEVNLSQPDGTKLDLFITGDEYHRWLHDKDGYTIIQDLNTKYYCWAILEDGKLVSSGFSIHEHTALSIGLLPNINISEESYWEIKEQFETHNITDSLRTPTTGTIQNLVVFISFLPDPASDPIDIGDGIFTESLTEFDAWFNSTDSGSPSVYRYFDQVSNGQLYVQSSFYPVSTGTEVVSYQASEMRSYYTI